MARLRQNFVGGELDAALTDVATSMSSPALAAMVAVTSPDTMAVVLDPDGIGGSPEIVTVTAHTAASTTATITRGAEGTTARAHVSGMEWGHGPTALDVDRPLLHVRDEKASGTAGGTPATAGTWGKRTLNTVKTNEIAGASLASDEVTLPAGTYDVDGGAPAGRTGSHQARLYNVTAGTVLMVGTSGFTDAAGNFATNRSEIRGRFTLAVTSTLRLEHRVGTATATNGYGFAAASGETEVYSNLLITKVG